MNGVNNTFNVVFDIDNTLVCTSVRCCKKIEVARFFNEKGTIFKAAEKTHYIFPGVIELTKLLSQIPNVRMSLFSSCRDSLRNKEVAKKIFGGKKSDVLVLSGENLTIYADPYKCKSKDLKKVLGKGDKLENAVLIDDDKTYIHEGQTQNSLICTPVDGQKFYSLLHNFSRIDKDKYLDDQGLKKIDIEFIQDESPSESQKKEVEKEECILLIETQEGFELGYLGESYRYVQTKLSQEESRLIGKDLNNIKRWKISDKIKKYIYSLVKRHGGITSTFPFKANQIYYIAGLLFKAIEAAFQKNISISEKLSQLQIKRRNEKNRELYLYGLSKLQEINPKLTFHTPKKIGELVSRPMDGEEESRLRAFIENEGEGGLF